MLACWMRANDCKILVLGEPVLTGLLAVVEPRHPDVAYIEKPRKLG